MSDSWRLIRNVNGGNIVLDVKEGSKTPGANIILWKRKPTGEDNDNQLWLFENGFLVSKIAGLVAEAPINKDGKVEVGIGLVLAEKRDKDNENQRWVYHDQGPDRDYRLRSAADNSLCVSALHGNVTTPGTLAVLDRLDEIVPGNQEWMFDYP